MAKILQIENLSEKDILNIFKTVKQLELTHPMEIYCVQPFWKTI